MSLQIKDLEARPPEVCKRMRIQGGLFSPLPPCLMVMALSGSGKSRSIRSVLSLTPQVIRHSSYGGKRFAHTQITWLTLDAPINGSPRGLLLAHSLPSIAAGHELVCVTALPEEFRPARERNLRLHGLPIDLVHATDNVATLASPKADTLNALKPLAFVDDFLPYFVGVSADVHRALILRGVSGSPNTGEPLAHTDSRHPDLASFSRWWISRH